MSDRSTYQDEDEADPDAPPSKSARKRAALAAQALGSRLIELREVDLIALPLPENVQDAIRAARTIRARGGLARQRQYIGKLMRDVDVAAVEAALGRSSAEAARETERFRRCEAWRTRLLQEGPAALDELVLFRPAADRGALERLVARAQDEARAHAPGGGEKTARGGAGRELFRLLRTLLDANP
jgi:ribosome-associated protein